jgi:cytochrome c oxidase subunit 2
MPLGNDPGGFDLFCTQYCGEQHSKMVAKVYVYDDKAAYEKKMIELANPFKEEKGGVATWLPYAQVGQKFYETYCMQCHQTPDPKNPSQLRGSPTGPPWKGLFKRDQSFSYTSPESGYTLKASDDDAKWEEYLSESILHPERKIVTGFQNQMPSFAAQFGGSDIKNEKRRAIIEYIKSIGSTGYKPAVDAEKNPDLFDAKKNPQHPQSLAAKKGADTKPANP